jgi:bifunctional oligoribonuclease and PAP phosphatase NrnA
MYPEADQINYILQNANRILIMQADNPDADSLGSALALESILDDMGKQAWLYCGIEMPGYLRYMRGWDRVQKELPSNFDASILVDASTMTLLEKLAQGGQLKRLNGKPSIVLDHHAVTEKPITFSDLLINDHTRASTGELIYLLAKQNTWPLPKDAQEFIMSSILGDTQGLSNQLASAETYRLMAEMIEQGVDRPALEELRREYSKMPAEIFKYKAELIKRVEFASDGRIASVTIPQTEINKYSPLYNPAPLIQNDMLQTEGVQAAVVFKHYDDGRITGAIRTNAKYPVAADLAARLGGGGHAFASGFKVTDGRSLEEVKNECITYASQLLDTLN